MPQPIKMYKVLRGGKFFDTVFPGRYAGNTTHKIFGRLDCKSGMLMYKENRVFFMSWKDAVEAGYRPCEKCKPDMSDKYPEHEALREALKIALSSKLHVGIWETTTSSDGQNFSKAWYVHINWQERTAKKGEYEEIKMGAYSKYPETYNAALELGRYYNIPVLIHGAEDENCAVIGITVKRANDLETARDKQGLKKLLESKGFKCSNWMF